MNFVKIFRDCGLWSRYLRWNVELRKVYNVLKIYKHVQYMEVVQDGRRRRRAPGVGNVGRTTLS